MNSPGHPVSKESNIIILTEPEMQTRNLDSFTFGKPSIFMNRVVPKYLNGDWL
jgi:hypothetical protein